MLTKTDIAALRQGDVMCVHLSRDRQGGLVRVIKDGKRQGDSPFRSESQEHIIDCKVVVDRLDWEKAIENGSQCFAHITFYHGQRGHSSSVIRTLREGDEISFRFWPDANRNGYVKGSASHLHCDVLYLDVQRKGKRHAEWHLDSSICENNSARMCYGFMPRD